MSTGASRWRETGNCARDRFRTAIARTHDGQGVSPMADEADAIYSAIAPYGLTRLAAAISWVEVKNNTWPDSVYWGLQHAYRNPWAMKTNGVWAKYPDYTMAARNWAERLTNQNGPYAATQTIAQLIAVYAPRNDGNDERAYVDAVCVEIDALPLSGEGLPVERNPYPQPTIYDLSRDYARFGASAAWAKKIVGSRFENRDGQRPRGIVLHIQDGTTPGSLSWWATGRNEDGTPVQASSTVIVNKDGSLLRIVPEQHGPWTNGWVANPSARGKALVAKAAGRNVNCVSLTIENEGRPGDALTAGQRTALLWQCAEWLRVYGLTVDDIYRHADIDSVNRANCPGPYYDEIVGLLRSGAGATPQPDPTPPVRTFPLLPEWLTDADLMTLSLGLADPKGPITNGYIADCLARGLWPAWSEVEERGGGDKRLWLAGGRIIDYLAAQRRIVVRGAA